ncbi:SMI1/KNR4 family protein, partial [Vibrio parahaemolyticus]
MVSLYGTLSKKIPDKFIIIEEVFPKDELEDIWSNYEEYLDEYLIFPFLGTLGEAV